MKKIVLILLAMAILFAACANLPPEAETTLTTQKITQTPTSTTQESISYFLEPPTLAPLPDWGPDPEGGFMISDGDAAIVHGRFRPRYYMLTAPFARLLPDYNPQFNNVLRDWERTRTAEEYHNECIIVGFVKHFDISREDFEKANEEMRAKWESIDLSPADMSEYELYPVDLIYTFDNEKINEFFRWENSIYAHEVGLAPSPWPDTVIRPPDDVLNSIREELERQWQARADQLTQEALERME